MQFNKEQSKNVRAFVSTNTEALRKHREEHFSELWISANKDVHKLISVYSLNELKCQSQTHVDNIKTEKEEISSVEQSIERKPMKVR